MKTEKIATTPYIPNQQYFILPLETWPNVRLEVLNGHNKEWRKCDYDICIVLKGKKKKTDKEIRIFYENET